MLINFTEAQNSWAWRDLKDNLIPNLFHGHLPLEGFHLMALLEGFKPSQVFDPLINFWKLPHTLQMRIFRISGGKPEFSLVCLQSKWKTNWFWWEQSKGSAVTSDKCHPLKKDGLTTVLGRILWQKHSYLRLWSSNFESPLTSFSIIPCPVNCLGF